MQIPKWKQSNWQLARWFGQKFLIPQLAPLWASIAFMGIVSLITMLLAHLVKPVFDNIFMAQNEDQLWKLGAIIFGLFIVKGCAAFGHSFMLARVGQKVSAQFQKTLFDRLVYADHALFSSYTSGKLLSLFSYDTQVVCRGLTQTLTSAVRDSLTLLCLAGLMFYQDFFLALLACFVFPLATYLSLSLGRRMRYFAFQSQAAMGRLHAFFQEVFQAIGMIKSYTMEDVERLKASEKINAFVNFNLKNARMKSFLHPLMESIVGFGVVVVILYGGYQVILGIRSPGAMMSFVTALLMAYEPLKKLGHLNGYVQESLAALERLYKLYQEPRRINDKDAAKTLCVTKGHIVFKDVYFSYEDRAPLFESFSCHMKGQGRIALVGASGAGKSTLFHLLLRFYDTCKGRIEIDGQDTRLVTLSSLRRSIAFVSQHITLFDDSVGANILYGCPGASRKEVEAAAQHAYAHDFIQKLPQGYDTRIGECGAYLSGGQRQRIAIARAVLKNAPILLLDEATSSLDTQSEFYVQKALGYLMKGRTTLVIAHRMQTVKEADLIYVLDKGALVAQGRHDVLSVEPGPYRDLILPNLSTNFDHPDKPVLSSGA